MSLIFAQPQRGGQVNGKVKEQYQHTPFTFTYIYLLILDDIFLKVELIKLVKEVKSDIYAP